MAKIPKPEWELAPEGVHNAVCCKFIDLGTQLTTFKEEEKEVRQCRVYFHLVDEKTSKGDNVVVFQKFTYSASPNSNFAKTLKAWLMVKDPANFDPSDLIGKPASITIEHNNGYANITNISGLAKGVKPKKSNEPSYCLFLTPEDFDANVFNELPEKTQGLIADTKEYLLATTAKKKTAKPAAKVPAKGKK